MISRRKPENIEEMLDLASIMSHSTTFLYKYGCAHVLGGYSADGTVFDYMAGVKEVY